MNPFEFDKVVVNEFFTDRTEKLKTVMDMLDGENHLAIVSPRRYGKRSLIDKALIQMKRPYILIDMMQVVSVQDFATHIVRGVFRLFPMERMKHLLPNFRIQPTITYIPETDSWDISFTASSSESAQYLLEDAMDLLQRVTSPEARLIVVLNEFQEITEISNDFAKHLHAIMQDQIGLNYVFVYNQKSKVSDVFEKKTSPFYHFAERMVLRRIPEADFCSYITEHLPDDDKELCCNIAKEILAFANVYPYYTLQLASAVYRRMKHSNDYEGVVEKAISLIVQEHDLDYTRLWQFMNRNERRVLQALSQGKNPHQDRTYSYSSTTSVLKKLVKSGYIIKDTGYQIKDPFLSRWVLGKI